MLAVAEKLINIAVARSGRGAGLVCTGLVAGSVDEAPKCRTQSRERSHNTKVGGEIFNAPDDCDNERHQAEDGTVDDQMLLQVESGEDFYLRT